MQNQKIDLGQTTLPGQHRFGLYVALAVLVLVALFVGKTVGEGDLAKAGMVIAILLGTGVGLWMGDKVWLIIPFVFLFDVGAIPLGGRTVELPEVGMAAMIGVTLIRLGLRKQKLAILRTAHLGVLLYAGWALLIFAIHPVGLAVMGAEDVGARFYVKIVLAFAAFIIMANQRVTEWDCKLIIKLWIVGAFVTMGWEIYSTLAWRTTLMESGVKTSEDDFYTWQQSVGRPAWTILTWLIARYSLAEIFGLARLHLPVIMAGCYVAGLFSGKRTGFASLLLAPMITGFFRREYAYLVAIVTAGAMVLAVMVCGHNTAFHLPQTVQRAIAYLPGDWDSEVSGQFGGKSGAQDTFRETLRKMAWDKIDAHPIVGEGFGIDTNEYLRLIYFYWDDPNMQQIAALAMGSSWHNTWLGTWADFGLPAVVFWAIYSLQSVGLSLTSIRLAPRKSASRVVMIMACFVLARELASSWVGGHSANVPFADWWFFGLVVALRNTLLAEKPVEAVPANRRRAELPAQVGRVALAR